MSAGLDPAPTTIYNPELSDEPPAEQDLRAASSRRGPLPPAYRTSVPRPCWISEM